MFVDHLERSRWIGELNVVYVPIANAVSDCRKPPFCHQAVLSFFLRTLVTEAKRLPYSRSNNPLVQRDLLLEKWSAR